MIITISGNIGSGKSTTSRLLAEKLGYEHYSIGEFTRELAEVKGISVLELGERAKSDKRIDLELDERQIRLGKTKDNFVIDSRLGFHFIPQSKKIFLKVRQKTAARRVFKQKREDENNPTYICTLHNIRERRRAEKKRYKEFYNLDYCNQKYYNKIIDTEKYKNVEEIVEVILQWFQKEGLKLGGI